MEKPRLAAGDGWDNGKGVCEGSVSFYITFYICGFQFRIYESTQFVCLLFSEENPVQYLTEGEGWFFLINTHALISCYSKVAFLEVAQINRRN